jgi:hypothetical protein
MGCEDRSLQPSPSCNWATLSCVQLLGLVLPIKSNELTSYYRGVSYIRDPIRAFLGVFKTIP